MTKLLAATVLLVLLGTAAHAVQCGDVNGDGAVDIGDAMVIAQYADGTRACGFGMFSEPRACDVNGDGACDMADADAIALCDAGMGSCAFECRPFRCLRGQRKLGARRQ